MNLGGEIGHVSYGCDHFIPIVLICGCSLLNRRETSNEDGVAIAWSVAERLLSKGAMTFFATHYPQICRLNMTYPSVRNKHLQAKMPDDGDGKILYTHKIKDGQCEVSSSYGVHVAATTGFPADVLAQVGCFAHEKLVPKLYI
jgi:DNA mismatch repair ATPase MutS